MDTPWRPSTVQNGGLQVDSFETNFIRIDEALQRLKLQWVEKLNSV